MERVYLVDQLKNYGELHPTRNTKILIGRKILNMVYYQRAIELRGLQINPQNYYVFITDKGNIIECSTPEDAVEAALSNKTFDYDRVEIGDYVDFGFYGQFYVCGENIDGTKFLVVNEPLHMAKRTADGFYLAKSLAKCIIEKSGQ